MKKNIIIILFSFILFMGCGGGGTTSETAITNEDIYKVSITNEAVDYSNYAWNLSPKNELHPSLSTYSIDDNANINMPLSNINNNKIKVAIIDQGFDIYHPDLKNKIYYDLTYGYVRNIDNTTLVSEYHGTAVAGVIASTYLGVAPNNVELILINIEFGQNEENKLIQAFEYARTKGAVIINCSWGINVSSNQNYTVSQTFLNLMESLKDDGISVVFASGNDGKNLDDAIYENDAEIPHVIGVGATSSLNKLASYSNYGSNIDIYAPGGGGKDNSNNNLIGILSLDLTGDLGDNSTFLNPNYKYYAGTSFSTPTITGVIALMLSNNSNLSVDDIRNILISTADTITDTQGNNYLKVNASKAIQEAINRL